MRTKENGITRFRPYYFNPVTMTGHAATMRANEEGDYVSWGDYSQLIGDVVRQARVIDQQVATITKLRATLKGIADGEVGFPEEAARFALRTTAEVRS